RHDEQSHHEHRHPERILGETAVGFCLLRLALCHPVVSRFALRQEDTRHHLILLPHLLILSDASPTSGQDDIPDEHDQRDREDQDRSRDRVVRGVVVLLFLSESPHHLCPPDLALPLLDHHPRNHVRTRPHISTSLKLKRHRQTTATSVRTDRGHLVPDRQTN